ncbi:Hypothetical protein Tpal_1352 [Trichococcus palustris]|uniref:UPF0291 protein Tpal_1352 n=1 Tax=Trichococcus palustris TaxID=140314 RepID=A0A143YHS9_9LACT|nr:DUF896 domain-containing protein [Trichococcus palustris]CZQ91057.1 Hypothetical protein Tpal_1352 [Trichococcus palustris]SFL02881.1 Uncharacterized protein YnzC, UPF0291/DUF896 family [Trichococcus palustris]
MKKLLDRINELARKAKTMEGLTETEKIEQQQLRQEYIQSFRSSFDDILLNSKVYDPEGNDITPQKLVDAQKEKRRKNITSILGSDKITFLNEQDKKKK